MAQTARPDEWFARPADPAGPGSTVEEAAKVASRLSAPSRGATRAGLPQRVPRAHLVPGAFEGGDAGPRSSTRDGAPQRSAEDVRERLQGYQQGVRRGRQAEG